MDDPSATLLPEHSEDLRLARDAELKKVLKLKLVLDELRRLDVGPNPSDEIKRALKLVSIGSYARLGEMEELVRSRCLVGALQVYSKSSE